MGASTDDDPPDAAAAARVPETSPPAAPAGDRAGQVSVSDQRGGGPAVDVERLRALTSAALAELGVPAAMAVDVWCVDAEEMARLNAAHMGEEGPTDVLAFPLDAPGEAFEGVPELLGDVVLCPEVAVAQAAEAGKPSRAELEMLLVHGLLHLLGHDHQSPEEAREMFALTDRLLDAWEGGGS